MPSFPRCAAASAIACVCSAIDVLRSSGAAKIAAQPFPYSSVTGDCPSARSGQRGRVARCCGKGHEIVSVLVPGKQEGGTLDFMNIPEGVLNFRVNLTSTDSDVDLFLLDATADGADGRGRYVVHWRIGLVHDVTVIKDTLSPPVLETVYNGMMISHSRRDYQAPDSEWLTIEGETPSELLLQVFNRESRPAIAKLDYRYDSVWDCPSSEERTANVAAVDAWKAREISAIDVYKNSPDGKVLVAGVMSRLTMPPTPRPTIKAPTNSPTKSPTKSPTNSPTKTPTKSPTASPTKLPTSSPTKSPTNAPTKMPTKSPTTSPTKSPTTSPTKLPTNSPTKMPTTSPTKSPTTSPTKLPTTSPTELPTESPTDIPTALPTASPSASPTSSPTQVLVDGGVEPELILGRSGTLDPTTRGPSSGDEAGGKAVTVEAIPEATVGREEHGTMDPFPFVVVAFPLGLLVFLCWKVRRGTEAAIVESDCVVASGKADEDEDMEIACFEASTTVEGGVSRVFTAPAWPGKRHSARELRAPEPHESRSDLGKNKDVGSSEITPFLSHGEPSYPSKVFAPAKTGSGSSMTPSSTFEDEVVSRSLASASTTSMELQEAKEARQAALILKKTKTKQIERAESMSRKDWDAVLGRRKANMPRTHRPAAVDQSSVAAAAVKKHASTVF